MAGIWSAVLGRERIGVNDDFFDGTSPTYPIPFRNVMIATFMLDALRTAADVQAALARLGEQKEALVHLRTAIQLDQDLATHAREDEDLKSLRNTPEFQSLTRNLPQSAR